MDGAGRGIKNIHVRIMEESAIWPEGPACCVEWMHAALQTNESAVLLQLLWFEWSLGVNSTRPIDHPHFPFLCNYSLKTSLSSFLHAAC